MKHRKRPYLHILPRVLLTVLMLSALLALASLPFASRRIWKVRDLADAGTPMPYETPDLIEDVITPTPFAPKWSTEEPTEAPPEVPSDVVTISVYTTLRLGDDNASVLTLQNRLTDLGYLDSDMPGSQYNESIANAVVLFQRACDMEQTGIADMATQSSLYAEDAQTYRIKRMDTGTDVLRLQQRLTDLGYYTERINGYFGPYTEQAVMMFQAINDLNVNGVLDYGAWTVLYSETALPMPALPTDTPTPVPTARRTASSQGSTATNRAQATASSRKTTPKPTSPASSGRKTYSSVVAAAEDQLGKPYQWSAEGPDAFDCSGLVYYCMKQSGHSISRHNAKSYSQTGSWTLITSMSDLKAGDLVFFKSDSNNSVNHAGICVSGRSMIHASSSKGKVVRTSLNQAYWERNFVCGRRP